MERDGHSEIGVGSILRNAPKLEKKYCVGRHCFVNHFLAPWMPCERLTALYVSVENAAHRLTFLTLGFLRSLYCDDCVGPYISRKSKESIEASEPLSGRIVKE